MELLGNNPHYPNILKQKPQKRLIFAVVPEGSIREQTLFLSIVILIHNSGAGTIPEETGRFTRQTINKLIRQHLR